jgi:hypothetical protein
MGLTTAFWPVIFQAVPESKSKGSWIISNKHVGATYIDKFNEDIGFENSLYSKRKLWKPVLTQTHYSS